MARSLKQALILLTSVIIMHAPASALAATKKSGVTFAGKYTVTMRPVAVESSNSRFECNKQWSEQWMWKLAKKGSRVTLTAPQTITLRGQITGAKTFVASYSHSELADAYYYPDTHSSSDYREQAFTFTSPTSGTVREIHVFNDTRADWEEKNGDRVEFTCTEYYTGTFRKK